MRLVKHLLKEWKLYILMLMLILVAAEIFCLMNEKKEKVMVDKQSEAITKEQYEKGYDFPIDKTHQEIAESDCQDVMRSIQTIYASCDKGAAENVVISEETAIQMMDVIQETGQPVTAKTFQTDMRNYEKMEAFLADAEKGEAGNIVVYHVNVSGGISREEFIFDGKDMYVLDTLALWDEKNAPVISHSTYTRVKEWKYTEKGWFSYEYCVPEPPEVTEIFVGETLMRVRPQNKNYQEMAEKYLLPIGYMGNNLLFSNWDVEHMEELDYNGLFQYFYSMEYDIEFDETSYSGGIPKEEFEQLMMKYLPITEEQLEQFAVYDSQNETYTWAKLGCGTYDPEFFGTSIPEITDIRENEDGTQTWYVDAVCELLGTDQVIRHEVTVRLRNDGALQYLGNQVLGDGLQRIPPYQYRISK